jgi:hypothetical protein
MLQVSNSTPFVPGLFVFPDPSGIDTLYVTLKGTFAIAERGIRVAEAQLPIVPGDVPSGEPGKSSLAAAGEAHPLKPATDVLLVGSAHAPGGRPAPYFGVSLAVGRLRKVVHVFGDRVWRAGIASAAPSAPVPAAEVPLVWERAWGGRHDLGDGRFLADLRNPVGVGFRGKRGLGEMNGTPVANLEDPRRPLRTLADDPVPAAFGPVAPSWLPRRSYAGTYDEAWRKTRAPYLPTDFDPRFFQAAPPDQIYPGFLQGGEPVELANASPAGLQRFAVPACRLAATVRVAGRAAEVPLRIETLLLEPDEGRFSLLWRGAVPCDKKALEIEQAAIALRAMEGVLP